MHSLSLRSVIKPYKLSVFLFCLSLSGCASLSTLGLESQIQAADKRVMTEAQAAEIVNQTLASKKISYEQTTQSQRITTMLERLRKAAGTATPFLGRIYEDAEPNAFSIGGKYVFISTGLLNMFPGDDDLIAGVLGHEIAHDIAGHHERQAMEAYWQNLATNLVKKSTGENKVVNALANASSALAALKYSRTQEKEADILGTVWASRAGYQPLGLIRFFERAKNTATSSKLATLLSTHPYDASRVETVKIVMRYLNRELTLPQVRTLDVQIANTLQSLERLAPSAGNAQIKSGTTAVG